MSQLATAPARRSPLALWLYLGIVALYCAWVLSMPVFPSQDGPLHLYYVNIFRHLLFHTPGVYADTFFINRYLPPYSLYYYGLIALGSVMSLPMADKLIVCACFVIFALGVRALCRVVSGESDWAPFLALPILINWSLMMGFVNYSLATGIACFALAVWCRNTGHPGLPRRALFLLLLLATILTHPVPWLFVLAFLFFDLALRLLRSSLLLSSLLRSSLFRSSLLRSSLALKSPPPAQPSAPNPVLAFFRLDLATALIGCLGYLYLRHFSNNGTVHPSDDIDLPTSLATHILHQLREIALTRGLTVFSGTHGLPLLYRLLILSLFAASLVLAIRHSRRVLRSGHWTLTETWLAFTLLFLLLDPLIPETLNGSFYFARRLLSLLFLSTVIAAAGAMASRPPANRPTPNRLRVNISLATLAAATSLLALGLAVQFISPVARDIATLADAPAVSSTQPGLLLRFEDSVYPRGLMTDPLYWAGTHFYRSHNQLLFNTGWLELDIIPVKPLPGRLHLLDDTYFVETPHFGTRLLRTDADARHTLARVGSVLILRPSNFSPLQSPFALTPGSPTPAPYAATWTCLHQPAWDLCTPPAR